MSTTSTPTTPTAPRAAAPVDRRTRVTERWITVGLLVVGTLVTVLIAQLTDLDALPRILITLGAMALSYPVLRSVLYRRSADQ